MTQTWFQFDYTQLFTLRYGQIEVIKYLIEQCHANVKTKDNGRTLLDISFQWNGIREYLQSLVH